MAKDLMFASLDFLNKYWGHILIAIVAIFILIVYLIVNNITLKTNGTPTETGRVLVLEKLSNQCPDQCQKAEGFGPSDPKNISKTAKCVCDLSENLCVCDYVCSSKDCSGIDCDGCGKYKVNLNDVSGNTAPPSHNTIIRNGFCRSHANLSELQKSCKKLSKKSCNLVDCCAYVHISQIGNEQTDKFECVAADATGGPIYKSDEKGNVYNFDYWYYLGKKHPR